MNTNDILKKAADAKFKLMTLSTSEKREALRAIAAAIKKDKNEILKANETDIKAARENISDVMLDRLALNEDRIDDMCEGILNVEKLDDPVGKLSDEKILDNGLKLKKISVPIGVVAIIYESRPNVTSDAAALCLMSGNVSVLRCGKEAYNTSKAIVNAIKKGLQSINESFIDFVNIIDDTSRDSATEIMRARGLVDVLIPRGGAGLINACVREAQVPVIETGTGICSVYIDKDADIKKAVNIVVNAKTQRPSVCNACEQLLVHKDIAGSFLPLAKKALVDDRGRSGAQPVELRLDITAAGIIDGRIASDEDFDTEFLDYILAVKIVESVEDACKHIRKHSTHHSEAIVTEDKDAAKYFTSHLDSAAIYINASTRFTDGGMFGLGCEMGISTQKLHARGPMGLSELTSYKYVIYGDGQVRE